MVEGSNKQMLGRDLYWITGGGVSSGSLLVFGLQDLEMGVGFCKNGEAEGGPRSYITISGHITQTDSQSPGLELLSAATTGPHLVTLRHGRLGSGVPYP